MLHVAASVHFQEKGAGRAYDMWIDIPSDRAMGIMSLSNDRSSTFHLPW